MVMNSIQLCEDHTLNSVYSDNSKDSAERQCRLVKIDYANGSINRTTNKKMKSNFSPYIPNDRLQLLSHHMEKKIYKQTFPSSFPLAVNIYKANSDEFKLKQRRAKKNVKSVLTLPNQPSALPQSCTVSDMNDSEYFNNEKMSKPKKRLALCKNKFQPGKKFEFVDRDAKYCSQVDIDLDCSSTDTIKRFKGHPKNKDAKLRDDEEVQPHDVWAVLRNINKFQFRPSPTISEDSMPLSPRKKKPTKKNKRKTAKVIETCRTEQYAYISNIDADCKSARSSSADRITVIESSVKDQAGNKDTKRKIKGEKFALGKLQNKKVHNRLKLLCSPEVSKHEERNTNNEAELGRCRMVKNNCADSHNPSPSSTKDQASIDFTSHTADSLTDSLCQISTEVELMRSSYSNFSISGRKGKDKFSHLQIEESYTFNGTTKVVLSKGQELALTKRHTLTMSPRKPRLVTTMPSISPVPKLTHTEIRRRLASIKYPVVILGKDQLSGTIEVQQNSYSQFDGLDNQIWPFMVHWSNNATDFFKPDIKDNKKHNNLQEFSITGTKKPTNFLLLNKQYIKTKKLSAMDISLPCPKQKEQSSTNNVMSMPSQFHVKTKPIRQLRDKMLKILYKKSSSQNIAKNIVTDGGQGDVEIKPILEKKHINNKEIDNGDKTIDDCSKQATDKYKPILRPVPVPTPPSNLFAPKQQRCKPKWPSSFIDNVINKIRAGVYYNQDNSMDLKSDCGSKEVSIQARVPLNSIGINVVEGCDDFTPKITIQKKREALVYLPGFDEDLPQIEIESMTRNQITVKHCVTNVMVQFDICVPSELEQGNMNYKSSMSFVPLTITESKTKVYKCKAKICNAMLPAEICSIIPMLVNKLENPDTKLALPSTQKASVDTSLSTITELSGSEFMDTHFPLSASVPLLPINMSPELRIVVNGTFPVKLQQPSKRRKYNVTSIDMSSLRELLPRPKIHEQYYLKLTSASQLVEFKINSTSSELNPIQTPKQYLESINSCTTIVPFKPIEASPTSWNCSMSTQNMINLLFNQVQRGMLNNSILNYNAADMTVLGTNPLCNNIIVNLKSNNPIEISNTVSIDLKTIQMETLYNALATIMPPKRTVDPSSTPEKCIEYINNDSKPKANKVGSKNTVHNVLHKHKKKVFVKLYKKCKSTSHISVEKSGRTALSKITNMENFFQALGTCKSLADVYDGYSSRKILASIIEMKSWITEISPRQALLVLLLSNKKDTSNLVRFRPVILQGIAVNRITRMTELDMEMEVIERESFCKLSELEGTPDVFNRVPYGDNLLEELYWIAKTTASDYQRPFDESSEKLLKALLEKRKKLNPSYLRVMARYVGLGLLKSPPKN